ncbi:phytanoyl-CoA dioxygenase family protein [Mangrovicoccus sp. HB161399]|uniref:phytanoyl-CoA dioxygenase family protein n=1 Tax=Mangrovicoccus sp. HB161399 TaxID=2720392 RepID=UPI001557E169|nr:phytanoyl-CoA dioxygenase family protein [Mangrovicoccus sp. HB161399]
MKDLAASCRSEDFLDLIATETTPAMCPTAAAVEKGIPVYDGAAVGEETAAEWASVIGRGPGVFVVRGAFADLEAIDAATAVFRRIIAEERESNGGGADHFAAAGANDRIWNSLQKLCLKDPAVYARYMANPVIDLACRAWLGPGYQIATQVNQVRPGGKAQAPHRDYHLGFMSVAQMSEYPAHIHAMAPTLVLQGGVAHSDMPVESGTTKLLPHSQKYLEGYVAATLPEFRAIFEDHCVQLPLSKGDAIFFSPALFHAAGENVTEDVTRMVNLIQTSHAFARSMETVDRRSMSKAVYPHLSALSAEGAAAVIAATSEGYPFPTNLDTDPPAGGLAPETQADVMARALREGWDGEALAEALDRRAAVRRA